MTALDALRSDYSLTIYDTATVDLAVGGVPDDNRDLFWASVLLQLQPDQDVPIPSVAPDMRILSYEVEPAAILTFSKDGADNYFVRSDESGSSGQFRLVFLADADTGYFNAPISGDIRVRDLGGSRLRPLPPPVASIAQRAHKVVGVHRNMKVDDAVSQLVSYFRQFAAKPPPESSGDIFWDLLTARAGVCRHRSFAFAVTANALGIPTRYLANEAHAWVEMWLPSAGAPDGRWIRVDLGGAANELQVGNAGAKSMHRPRSADPFPQPSQYAETYTRLTGAIEGLSASQLAEARTPVAAEGDDTGPWDSGPTSTPASGSTPPRPAAAPGRRLSEITEVDHTGNSTIAITIGDVAPQAFRGEATEVTGRLVGPAGGGVAGQKVDIYLAPSGYEGEFAQLVGHTLSRPDGTFRARVALPAEIELGDYEVYAATPGDDTYRPSVSE
jgi:hypothetical protein